MFAKQENATWTGHSESPNDYSTEWYVSLFEIINLLGIGFQFLKVQQGMLGLQKFYFLFHARHLKPQNHFGLV